MNASGTRPAHHRAGGGFLNPWPTATELGGLSALLRWRREQRASPPPPDPPPGALPLAEPAIAAPRAAPGELRVTWVGHATFLIQIGGFNLLTDPMWSQRASPLSWAGPARLVPPAVAFEALPPIDAVLLSHDHYDHLDSPTVRRLRRRFGDSVAWFTPLGYRRWFARRGVRNVHELDWGQREALAGKAGTLQITALPAQHWTSRTPWDRQQRLWASWAITASDGRRLYFGGDSGYFPGYAEIGRRAGPFDVVLLPIGAYAPRWFMRPVHLDPEEALRAWHEIGGQGILGSMHWGTFRLSDEDVLEPPERLRAAWAAEGLPPQRLWIARHGETLTLAPGRSNLPPHAV
ncbi:MAG TPA: MBL fold metallo-hydrolase [Longimicrobiaceae bacterium]|nr:MBL fold metallo-hydrolase [Longimicrobiaceae bacterium]